MKSTKSIVKGNNGDDTPFDDLRIEAEPVEEHEHSYQPNSSRKKPWWLIPALLFVTVLAVAAVVMLMLSYSAQEATPPPTLPSIEAEADNPLLTGDTCLLPIPTVDMTGTIKPGDLVAICNREGVIPALQYVVVQSVGTGGTVTVAVTQDQLSAYLRNSGKITLVIRASDNDPNKAELLEWQQRYNTPTVTLKAAAATTLTADLGQQVELPISCTIEPAEVPKDYSYYASNPEIVEIENGVITAVSVGETDITAICFDKQVTFHLTVAVLPKEIKLSHTGYWIAQGTTKQLRVAEYVPADVTDQTVTWSSADTSIATVADDGTVAAAQLGQTTITAKCGDVTADCVIVVYASATSLSVSKQELRLKPGESEQLIAMAYPQADHRRIVWTSSDEGVATVSSDGTVTAVSAGTATISVTADGLTEVCTVTVR